MFDVAGFAHRQVVLTIPKRLRLHARVDRSLLGKLAHCAWTCIQAEVRRLLRRRPSLRDGARVVPGMVAAIQTHGELLHWHPHLHLLLTCGAFPDPGGDGLQVGTKRNYQILSPLDCLAPPPLQTGHAAYSRQGSSPDPLLRLVLQQKPRDTEEGGGSSKIRRGAIRHGRRGGSGSKSQPSELGDADQARLRSRPLSCLECGGEMAVVAFIEPPQEDVIEKILRHCGLWRSSAARAPPADGKGNGMDGSGRARYRAGEEAFHEQQNEHDKYDE